MESRLAKACIGAGMLCELANRAIAWQILPFQAITDK